jgi:hypothetical protein
VITFYFLPNINKYIVGSLSEDIQSAYWNIPTKTNSRVGYPQHLNPWRVLLKTVICGVFNDKVCEVFKYSDISSYNNPEVCTATTAFCSSKTRNPSAVLQLPAATSPPCSHNSPKSIAKSCSYRSTNNPCRTNWACYRTVLSARRRRKGNA